MAMRTVGYLLAVGGVAVAGVASAADRSCACVGEPVPLCQGPTREEAGWGPYQFPRAFVLANGVKRKTILSRKIRIR